MKLASTGSIFLATGGTTSSSSQNSSLHKGAGEAAAESDNVVVDTVAVDDDIDDGHTDPNSVSPYASTSLIEQLRGGRGNFPDVIPPPPRYPPPPVPQDDSPPATPCSGGPPYQAPPPNTSGPTPQHEECHYAQSDLQKTEEAFLASGGAGAGGYCAPANGYLAGYPQEQYWPNGAPVGMCYMQQPVVPTMTNQRKQRTI